MSHEHVERCIAEPLDVGIGGDLGRPPALPFHTFSTIDRERATERTEPDATPIPPEAALQERPLTPAREFRSAATE